MTGGSFYDNADDVFDQINALEGFTILKSVSPTQCKKLIEIIETETGTVRHTAIAMLCKWQHDSAKPYLMDLINGPEDKALIAIKAIYCHARNKAEDWIEPIRKRIPSLETYDALRWATYILDETKIDYAQDIVPFCQNKNIDIKSHAFYSLGKSPTKHEYILVFIEGLKDKSQRVVHTCLQALEGVRDVRLLEPYYYAVKQFECDEYCLEVNLEHRVREWGFVNVVDFYRAYRKGTAEERLNSTRGKIIRFVRSIDKL